MKSACKGGVAIRKIWIAIGITFAIAGCSGPGSSSTSSSGGTGSGGSGGGGTGGGSTASFSINETAEINGTLTGTAPYYVDSSTLTLTANTTIWAFTWSQYSASFYAVDSTNAQYIKNGSGFYGYLLAPSGSTGLNHVTLPAGTWYVAIVPNQTITSGYSNKFFAEMAAVTLPGAVESGNFPVGTGVVNSGGWQTTPFTVGSSRMYIETEGAGGIFAVMTGAQANTFAATYPNGFTGGSIFYTDPCGSTGAPALELECEIQLPAGNYALVYINNGASASGGAANIAAFQ